MSTPIDVYFLPYLPYYFPLYYTYVFLFFTVVIDSFSSVICVHMCIVVETSSTA